ncbi:ABC transporter substrate-binding protein [Bifidobacterium mongoliense]|uniref:Cytochrome C oxidase subunit IV n=1 Tax=Bifidobacterium mongoliense DSM 21395 TaxID=1437603 RepID=A0A087BVK4_9BIFI|nr:extracellular solute-binding protein [Bifidobacterium mongoliense]KFI75054.1 cytochrome C oxidase subunit IV [Bifidobacterium mongoliense DSM 21395]
MKKSKIITIFSAVTAALTLVGSLGACGGSSNDSSKLSKDSSGASIIKFGINVANPSKQEPATSAIVNAFNKKNKGKYKVVFEAADTESHSKNMKLEASDGTLPQVFWVEGAQAPEFNKSGVLMDMTDFLKENSDVKTALDGTEKAFQANKVQDGLPYQSNVQGIFYNKALFDKAGVKYPTDSTTFEEFLDMVGKLKASGVTPLSIGSKNSSYAMWEFNNWLTRYGWGDNIQSVLNGKKKFADTQLPTMFEKLEQTAKAGAFPENMSTVEYFDAKQQFDSGKAAMFGSGQWDCAEFNKNLGKNIGFWWGPQFSDSKASQKTDMKVPSAPIAVSASVAKNDETKQAVYTFLKYYYSKDAAQLSYKNAMFPATSYQGLSPSADNYSMKAMTDALSNGWKSPVSAPDLTVPSSVQQVLYDSLFGVMQGVHSPQEAVVNMDNAIADK